MKNVTYWPWNSSGSPLFGCRPYQQVVLIIRGCTVHDRDEANSNPFNVKSISFDKWFRVSHPDGYDDSSFLRHVIVSSSLLMYHVGWLEVILCFTVMGVIKTWRHAPDTVCLRPIVPDTSVSFNLPYITCDVHCQLRQLRINLN